MIVNVKVKLYSDKIKSIEETCNRSLQQTGATILSDIKTRKVVHDDESLKGSGFLDLTRINQGVCRVIWCTPNAKRLYWHPEVKEKDKNHNAQSMWIKAYEPGGEKEKYFKNVFTMFLRKNSGGVIK